MNNITIKPIFSANDSNLCIFTKKFIFFVFILLAITTGCEKPVELDDNSQSKEGNTANANLVLRIQMTRGNESNIPWKTLMFEIYKDNKKIKDIVQHEGDSNYGTASVQLTPDTYQVLVLAHNAEGNPSRPRPTEIKFDKNSGYSDVFYSYGDIVVKDEKEEHEITLQRATSLIRFRTKDVVPDYVQSIQFHYEGGSAVLNAQTGYGITKSEQSVYFDIDETQKGKPLEVELYTFKRENNDTLILTVTPFKTPRGADNPERLASKEFKVPIKHREISDFSGYFFSNNPSDNEKENEEEKNDSIGTSFCIKVDTAWAGINYYTY